MLAGRSSSHLSISSCSRHIPASPSSLSILATMPSTSSCSQAAVIPNAVIAVQAPPTTPPLSRLSPCIHARARLFLSSRQFSTSSMERSRPVNVRLRRPKLLLHVSVQVSLVSWVTGITYTKDRLEPAALFQACRTAFRTLCSGRNRHKRLASGVVFHKSVQS